MGRRFVLWCFCARALLGDGLLLESKLFIGNDFVGRRRATYATSCSPGTSFPLGRRFVFLLPADMEKAARWAALGVGWWGGF